MSDWVDRESAERRIGLEKAEAMKRARERCGLIGMSEAAPLALAYEDELAKRGFRIFRMASPPEPTTWGMEAWRPEAYVLGDGWQIKWIGPPLNPQVVERLRVAVEGA